MNAYVHDAVVRESAGGHDTTYRFGYRGDPLRRRIDTATGAFVDVTMRPDGRESTRTLWDGSSITTTTAPDPTLGHAASFTTRAVLHRPIAGDTIVTASRTYTGSSLPRTDTMTNGDRTFAQTISAAGSGWSVVSNSESGAADRRTTTTLDARGRVTRVEVPGQHPVCITYSSSTSWRPSQILQAQLTTSGTITCDPTAAERRRTDLGYHLSQRWLTSIDREAEDPTTLVPDGRGWIASVTLPGRTDTLVIDRDSEGNLTELETPGHTSSQRHQPELRMWGEARGDRRVI